MIRALILSAAIGAAMAFSIPKAAGELADMSGISTRAAVIDAAVASSD